MSNYLQADVASVLSDIDALLAAYPELAEDDDLRRDMLEGETDAHRVLARIVAVERDADSMVRAVAERQRDLAARKARHERKKEAMRVLLMRLLKAAGLPKVALPEATVSITKKAASVEIVDADALPAWAYETERKPKKKEIMERLAANENVPGAVLKAGGETLTVRAA